MFETVLLLSFCAIAGLVFLLVVIWLAATGRLLDLDGILLAILSLTLGGLFMANLAWSVHTGEARAVLEYFRSKKSSSNS